MKRFEFSLERLLRVKQQLERLAELEQQRAVQAVEQARAAVEHIRTQLARIAESFTQAIGRTMTPQQWVCAADMAERLGHALRTAEQELTSAEQRLLTAAQERAQLATEVEAIATLRRQHWEQWRREAAKADQQQLDEVSLRLWHRRPDDDTSALRRPHGAVA
ncbi:MAG: flagellar FliJ family protein [Gemmataceae bacterium]|nr:flagellar FliJ family protein [Gemmata sp.]MDW8199017.1 flagellar FliJ family protein [Gemmataceae bacterium]